MSCSNTTGIEDKAIENCREVGGEVQILIEALERVDDLLCSEQSRVEELEATNASLEEERDRANEELERAYAR